MNKFNNSFWRIFFLLILVICVTPLILISLYNHSSADDYSIAISTRHAWIDTKNILYVIREAIIMTKNIYFNWQGNYCAVFFNTLQPAIFGEDLYFLSTLILILSFLFSVFFSFRIIFGKILNNYYVADILASIVSTVSIALTPYVSEAFYWWNGSSIYLLFNSLMIVQISLLVDIIYFNNIKINRLIVCCIIAFMISGGNHISMLLNIEITFLLFIYYCIFEKKKNNEVFKSFIIINLVTFIGVLLNVLAPGNKIRMSFMNPSTPLEAIYKSFLLIFNRIPDWTSPILIVSLIIMFYFIWTSFNYSKRNDLRKIKIVFIISVVTFFLIITSSFTPTYYALVSEGPGRAMNIRFFLWVIFCLFLEYVIIFFIKYSKYYQKFRLKSNCQIIKKKITTFKIVFSISISMILILCINKNIKENINYISTSSAIYSMISGEAKVYDYEIDNRINILLNSKDEIIELSPLSYKPHVLFFDDIQEDSSDWRNIGVASFFRKKEVILKNIDK